MLKRIKVRGKLLLLLATPLTAVMVFAYSGINDRTERTTFQEGEARIAELADAGSDLSLAIQVERIRLLQIERLMTGAGDQLVTEQEQTNAQLDRWIATIAATRGDLENAELLASIDDLAERLPTTLAPDRGSDKVTGTLLASASRAVDDITIALASEAQDLDLFREMTDLNSLISLQSSYATITSIGSEAIVQGQIRAVAATLISEAEGNADIRVDAFTESADRQYVIQLERLQNSGVLPNPSGESLDGVTDIQEFIDDPIAGGVSEWLRQGETQLSSLNELIDTVVTDATDAAQQEATAANEEAQSFLVLAGSVILLALVMAIIIGRSISRPLTRLTRNAEQLSSEELPALVESMRSAGRAEVPALTPIEAKGSDEVAQLAHAISEIQQVTMDVAEEQGDLLRRGISDIFVNLARRNQSLLDRQIEFIDRLEAREENPDQLQNLFRLDHLATRMRRNAESLLVLAGAEPARRRGAPVEIVDVLRVAMGEIEDFSRITIASVDPSSVAGSVAVDLAHLMSELMENATQFSPPEAAVDVVGYRIADDSYQLTLADHGIGMSDEQLMTSNKTLAEPPIIGLDLSRSLGFTVVSRLANRLGVSVQLTGGAKGGVTAVIMIPAELIGRADEHLPSPPSAEPVLDEPAAANDELVVPAGPSADEPEIMAPQDATSAEIAPAPPEPIREPTTAYAFGETPPTFDPAWADSESSTESAPKPAAGDAGLAKLPTRRPKPAPATTPPESVADIGARPPPEPASFAADPAIAPEPPSAFVADSALAPAPAESVPTEVPRETPLTESADGDLFAAFGTPPGTPRVPSEPGTDLFAPVDGGDSLPRRGSAPSNAEPPVPEQPATPFPAAERVEGAVSPAAPEPPSEPVPLRDPAAVGAVSPQVTSAGLIRRTPRHVDVPAESKYAADAPARPAVDESQTSANRSPDEVRQMLSRYRAGLRKGRVPGSDNDQPNRES